MTESRSVAPKARADASHATFASASPHPSCDQHAQHTHRTPSAGRNSGAELMPGSRDASHVTSPRERPLFVLWLDPARTAVPDEDEPVAPPITREPGASRVSALCFEVVGVERCAEACSLGAYCPKASSLWACCLWVCSGLRSRAAERSGEQTWRAEEVSTDELRRVEASSHGARGEQRRGEQRRGEQRRGEQRPSDQRPKILF